MFKSSRAGVLIGAVVIGWMATISVASPMLYTTYNPSSGSAQIWRYEIVSGAAVPSPSAGNSGAVFASNAGAAGNQITIGPDVNSDGIDDLFVAQRLVHKVREINGSTGALIAQIPGGTSPVNQDRGVAVRNGIVYYTGRDGATGQPDDTVWTYNLATASNTLFASGLATDPYSLAFDASGNLFVSTDGAGKRIYKLDSSGGILGTYIAGDKVMYMALGQGDGFLYFTIRQGTPAVQKLDMATGVVSTVITAANFGHNEPRGIAFGPDLDNDGKADLYVATAVSSSTAYIPNNNQIFRLSAETGTKLGTLLGSTAGLYATEGIYFTEIPEPMSLLLLAAGSVVVAVRRRRA